MKVILTKNFIGKTDAKYCVIAFGAKPETVIELNDITLENVEQVHIARQPETRDLESFDCGIVMIGDADIHFPGLIPEDMLIVPPGKTGIISWDGSGFEFEDNEGFDRAKKLVVTADKLEVVA